jgi:hypothetical protein
VANCAVLWNRLSSGAGLICLAMSLLLLPVGVRSVRADDDAKGPVSADSVSRPSEATTSEKPAVARPVTAVGDAPTHLRPGGAGGEDQAEVVVLNTRGFNYGPPRVNPDPVPVAVDLEAKAP